MPGLPPANFSPNITASTSEGMDLMGGTIETQKATVKQQFENKSSGWQGAVTIDPLGHQRAISVAPGGRVWLSHAEQVLTANAPQDPKNNPFVEQTFVQINHETGERREVKITPLVPVTDSRYVPASERFVPAEEVAPDEAEAEQTPEPEPEPPAAPPKASPRAQAAAKAATGAAATPVNPAPEGSFQPDEEAGTPEAPAAPMPPPAPPKPYSPGSTEK